MLRGDEALAYPGADPIADGMGVIQAAAAASGTQVLMRVLTGVHGSDDQADQWAKIKCFFRLRRNRVPLQDYLAEHDLCWDEATSAGLAMNNVGRSCFLLDNCGLPEQQLDNILLLTNHDLERYDEIRSHLDKIAKKQQPTQLAINDYEGSAHHAEAAQLYGDSGDFWRDYDESSWTDGWVWQYDDGTVLFQLESEDDYD